MRVTVRDRATEAARWGRGPLIELRTLEIADTCPTCGGPRGESWTQRSVEDGEWYEVDRWENPCGHVDTYAAVLREAAAAG